jgi:hypothetical protein
MKTFESRNSPIIELYDNRAQKVCFTGVEESVTERDAAVRSPS